MHMKFHQGVYYSVTATLLGDLVLGEDVNVWPSASIRGDVAQISIGRGTNVQDCAVLHCDSGVPNTIGEDVTIGHSAIVHGVSIGDGSLIGMGAKVLGGTKIGKRCLIGAGALVPPNLEVPDDHVVIGLPGRVMRETNEKEKAYLKWLAPHYVALAKKHHENPDDPSVKIWGVDS